MNTLMVFVGVLVLFVTMEVSLGVDIGGECSEDDDCTGGDNIVCRIYHMCENGTCECKKDYHLEGTTCKAIKDGGESCADATDVCEPGNNDVTCTDGTCSCAADKTWVGGMCVTTTDYIALGQSCTEETEAKCYGHIATGGDAMYRCADNAGTMMCMCTDDYMEDSDHAGICIKKKKYNDACTPGTDDQQCPDAFPCRALTDGGENKCNCPAPAEGASEMKWNGRTKTCVASDALVDVAKGETCTMDNGNECAGMLHCAVCPGMTDKKCRDVKTGSGSGSSEETSGAAHLAAGVATLFLSTVAMLL